MIRRLYALLKPGGRMVVYEHARAVDSISRKIQGKFAFIIFGLLPCSVCVHLGGDGGGDFRYLSQGSSSGLDDVELWQSKERNSRQFFR